MARDAIAEVEGQGVAANKIKLHVRAHIRYAGTDTPLIVDAGTWQERQLASLRTMKSAFERAHKAQFGFIDRKKSLVIEAVSVEAVGGGATFKEKPRKTKRARSCRRRRGARGSSPAANGTVRWSIRAITLIAGP